MVTRKPTARRPGRQAGSTKSAGGDDPHGGGGAPDPGVPDAPAPHVRAVRVHGDGECIGEERVQTCRDEGFEFPCGNKRYR